MYVVQATHKQVKEPIVWGPFFDLNLAQQCCSNLAANPDILRAVITDFPQKRTWDSKSFLEAIKPKEHGKKRQPQTRVLERVKTAIDTIEGYGRFTPGQDGYAGLKILRDFHRKAERAISQLRCYIDPEVNACCRRVANTAIETLCGPCDYEMPLPDIPGVTSPSDAAE